MKYLEDFFKFNNNMHKELSSLAYTNGGVDEESIIKYADELYQGLKYIHQAFSKLSETIYYIGNLEDVFRVYYEEFLNCKYTKESFVNYYNKYFANMRPEFVDSVKANCCGYSIFSNASALIQPGITINELLHVVHSSILNNENVYQQVPLMGFKTNDNNEPINFRGDVSNLLGNQLYTYFPASIDCGITDIVAFDNKIIVMIRDLGHAMTLDIDQLEDGKVAVHYFIPKLCNIEMINALPGIHAVSPDANIHSGARGYFEVPKEQALESIYSFLSKVPTDAHMIQRPFN